MTDKKDNEPPCSNETIEQFKQRGFFIGPQINYGSFSKVYRGKMKDLQSKKETDIAVKVIDLDKTSLDYRNKFLPRELFTIRKIRHPSVVAVHDIFSVENKVFIFMDICDGGDILDYLKDHSAIPEAKAKKWFKQIAEGLRHIHLQGIAHRDLKSENVLIDKQGNAKITDFGFARICYDPKTGKRLLSETYCGSAAYVAPEVLKGTPYNPMIADIWGLGCVLYVMVNNALPFDDSDMPKMVERQQSKKWSFSHRVEKNLSPELKDLITKMLEPNLAKRLTMRTVLSHPWLTDTKLTDTKSDTRSEKKGPPGSTASSDKKATAASSTGSKK
ncbi:testis-specific serine/threonine-protein kinase 3-like isoform X1 [Leptotrombidium deliense]|uniref:Testis-specific serine/threonine-protein kinase 3-like isoform X1 n=1 Tax=Leptotrombidium deliense TaxID=299467 RepID=A0A443SV85_9ACAR|nr:testis-specific serine/threonine-protein kinase 3-like isoform X1 [Leptotrombidium deliense]